MTVNCMLDLISGVIAGETEILEFQSFRAEWASLAYCADGKTTKDRWRRKERDAFIRRLRDKYVVMAYDDKGTYTLLSREISAQDFELKRRKKKKMKPKIAIIGYEGEIPEVPEGRIGKWLCDCFATAENQDQVYLTACAARCVCLDKARSVTIECARLTNDICKESNKWTDNAEGWKRFYEALKS